jgi:hypothetical protein
MPRNVEYASRPDPFTLEVKDSFAVITLADNIEEHPAEGEEKAAYFTADIYIITQPETPNIQQRLSDGFPLFLARAKADDLAEVARTIRTRRDELLKEVDKRGSIFRLGLSAPEGGTFTAWLSFLRSFGAYLSGEWAKYRQLLLDVPQQPGFPYEIDWPLPPADNE